MPSWETDRRQSRLPVTRRKLFKAFAYVFVDPSGFVFGVESFDEGQESFSGEESERELCFSFLFKRYIVRRLFGGSLETGIIGVW